MKKIPTIPLTCAVLCAGLFSARAATTYTFQEGVNGYSGTLDTQIRFAAPDTSEGEEDDVSIDGSDGGGANHMLIRFENIFGTGPNQIPPDSSVLQATLTLYVTGQGSSPAVHRLLKEWDEDTTWNSFDPDFMDGVTADDIEAATEPDATFDAPGGTPYFVDIPIPAQTVQAWLDGDEPNYGWALIPSGTDGVDLDTSESSTPNFRPKLTVVVGEEGETFVRGFAASPKVITFTVADGTLANGQSNPINESSINLTLDGSAVTPTVSKTDGVSTISYVIPTFLPSGSTHTAALTYMDSATPPRTVTSEQSFTVDEFPTIPAGYAVTGVNTSNPGFAVRVHQIPVTRTPGDENSIENAERQLADGYINPDTGEPYENEADLSLAEDGVFNIEGVINWDQVPATRGNFSDASDPPFPDEPIPGIPGINFGVDNIVAEVITFLELEAGYYEMGVNSDDGFKVTVGLNPKDVFTPILGSFNGGRGSADSIFAFSVEQAGTYPFRLLWWEGGGDANLEWFTVDPASNQKILINDTSNDNAVQAYRTGPLTAYVQSISPFPGSTEVPIDANIVVVLGDGTTDIAANSIQLTVNGQAVTPNVSKEGELTTVTYDPATNFTPESTVNATLVYSDSATPPNTATHEFSFTTAPDVRPIFTISEEQMWRYDASNVAPPANWRDPDFDDSAWPEGAGLLAAETGATAEPIRTELFRQDAEGNNITSYYFRTRFNFDGDPATVRLRLRHVVDDAVVFYLNGVEVHRFGLAEGVTPEHGTFGSGHENAYEGPFDIPTTSLRQGENVLAAQLLQSDLGSSDAVFGAELQLIVGGTPPPPPPPTFEGVRLGLSFGANETNAVLGVSDVAGVPGFEQAGWNNLFGPSGTTNAVIANAGGTNIPTTVTVEWSSNGTWASTGRGEENNALPEGPNHVLMTGYLDTGNATTNLVTISNLPVEIASLGYDVIVYASGGVGGRGGAYRIWDATSGTVLQDFVLAQSGTNLTEFVEVPQDLGEGEYGVGNYILFTGLTATNITVESTTGSDLGFGSTPRAPINAIQLVAPSSGGGGGEGPISIARNAEGGVVITFEGTLEQADAVTGPWTAVAGATSPHTVTPDQTMRFYRVAP